MKILVTGGCGYIGSHTCVEILDDGYDVVIIDNLSNSKKGVVDKIREITGKPVTFYEGDLNNKDLLRKIFTENDIQAVIHLADHRNHDDSNLDPLSYYKENLNMTLNLLDVMKDFDCKKIVYSSTANLYKKDEISPIIENADIEASNAKDSSMEMIERILKDLYESDNNWSIAILRYCYPAGAHKSHLIGNNSEDTNNPMNYIIKVATGELPRFVIPGNDYNTPDGTLMRDFIHVVDLANGHVKAAEKVLSTREYDLYNLSTGEGITLQHLAHIFEKVNNVRVISHISDRISGEPDQIYLSSSYALKKLIWKTTHTLEDMCKDSYDYIKRKQIEVFEEL